MSSWFHWAPRDRRAGIIRRGLVPNQWSRDRLWKPPYVCLSDSPHLAWNLSGVMDRDGAVDVWDLWEVWVDEQRGYEELFFDDGKVKEIRVYDRIFKRNIWWTAERHVAKAGLDHLHKE